MTGTTIFIIACIIVALLVLRGYILSKKDVKENKEYELGVFYYKEGSIQAKILYYLNQYREDYAVPLLVGDRFSNILAGVRVKEMIKNYDQMGEITHTGFANKSKQLLELGADCVGENIAYGYGTAQGVVQAFYKSPGHRKNMINPRYDWVGIYVQEHIDRNFYCVIFGGDDITN